MHEDSLRVAIDEVVDENARLPFRISDEMETVGSALGSHVAWPSDLVVEKSIEKCNKKAVAKNVVKDSVVKNLSSLPGSLLALYYMMEKSFTDVGIHVKIDFEVFGQDITVWILKKDDVIPFCNLEPSTGNCIITYVCHLYEKMKKDGTLGKFMFVNPFTISCGKSVEARARALSDRILEATSNQLVFVPCNVGKHWILTIIDFEKDRVFLMDPISHRNRDTTWKSIVDTAMNLVNARKGKKFKKSASWDVVKGPIQPDSNQCGFYVMKFMKDVIAHYSLDAPTSLSSMFKNVKTYTLAEIDEIREEWATCVIKHAFD
ncbi:uncharacterized protein LOC131011160 [Salvia miltiorrhiza]|uniref:uncharacterized protein LOC131011160 n=2 Tax=Salvia miltiorrhiza TaxID=226208 RepID=UPI0025ACBEDE|nr:uncharacterized protein LOC131011160 [Salvia miltiorrhiza]